MSFWDDITPDFSDPGQMAAFGALGNVLQAGTAPRFAPNGNGITGGGALNALAALTGAGIKGMNEGAQFAQQYQGENLANTGAGIANQTNQLNLNRQAALQPMMLNAAQNSMQPGGGFGQQTNNSGMPPLTAADSKFATAYQLAMGSGKLDEAAKVLQSWAEHSPDLAGAIEKSKTENGIVQAPNGPIWGSMIPQPTVSGIQNGIISDRTPPQMGPGAQAAPPSFGSISPPPPITPVASSALQPIGSGGANFPPQGQPPMPPPATAFNGLPNGINIAGSAPPVVEDAKVLSGAISKFPVQPAVTLPPSDGTKTGTEGQIKEVTDTASNLADAGKTYNVMISNFPNVMQRINDMASANKSSSFGPLNDKEGDGLLTKYHDAMNDPTSVANTVIQQRAAQGVLPELSPQLGDIKPNKSLENWANQANNIDLSKGQAARQSQFDGLAKGYIQNMISYNDQIKGLGGTPAPLPPPVVAQAVKYGVMSRPEAIQYLQQNHGMQ